MNLFSSFIVPVCLLLGINDCNNKEPSNAAPPAPLQPVVMCAPAGAKDRIITGDDLFFRSPLPELQENAGRQVLHLDIKSVKNPALEPFSFAVLLETPTETINAGNYSLYPNDNPGNFRVNLTPFLEKLKASKNTCLIVKFQAAADQVLSTQVRVEFESPVIKED